MANLGAGAIYSVPFTASVSTAESVDPLASWRHPIPRISTS